MKDLEKIKLLTAPLHTKWKIQSRTKPKQDGTRWAVCVAYNDARDVYARLDEVFGLDWATDFKMIGDQRFGGIGIRMNGEWIWRWDNGVEPGSKMDEEKRDEGMMKKGETSDSVKRAGYQWGIGRYLYSLPKVCLPVSAEGHTQDYAGNKLYSGEDITHYIEHVVLKEWEKSGKALPGKIYFLPGGNAGSKGKTAQARAQPPEKVFDETALAQSVNRIQKKLDEGQEAQFILSELKKSGYQVPRKIEKAIRAMKPHFSQRHFEQYREQFLTALEKGKTIDQVIANVRKGTHLSKDWEEKIRELTNKEAA